MNSSEPIVLEDFDGQMRVGAIAGRVTEIFIDRFLVDRVGLVEVQKRLLPLVNQALEAANQQLIESVEARQGPVNTQNLLEMRDRLDALIEETR